MAALEPGTTVPQPSNGSTHAKTTIPQRNQPSGAVQERRKTRGMSRESVLNLAGAVVGSLSITMLLFGRLAPFRGRIGFVVVAFVAFVAVHALLVSMTEDRPAVIDSVMSSLFTAAAVTAGAALVSVVGFTLWRGRSALLKKNLYTQDMSTTGPLDPLTKGGILHAIAGSLIIVGLALIVTVPVGLACAVFLNETRSRMRGIVRSVVTAMTALPSILAGLFVFAVWVLILGFERSGLAAAIAISIMMLPIIVRSAEVVLRIVPGNLREASEATGAPMWRTVWHVVLPTAKSGLVNAVILGVARGVGETAPVLLVSGVTSTMNKNPQSNPMMSLPLAVFEFVRSPQQALIQRGFATAAVLMVLVLLLFTIARVVAGRPAGRQSKRQARRTSRRSLRDLERILEITGGTP